MRNNIIKFNSFCFLFLCLLLVIACSPERRLARLLENNPQLLKTDTVWKHDTVITKEVKADTVFKLDTLALKDTITLEKERLKVQLVYKDRKIYLNGECKPDTVFIKEPIISKKYTVEKTDDKKSHSIWDYG